MILLPWSLFGCAQDYALEATPVDVNPGDVVECGFTEVEGTDFSSYDCNPVFTTTDEPWAEDIGGVAFAVTEVLGHPFFQAWYIGFPSDSYGEYGLGYAVSPEGTDWTPHPDNSLLGASATGAWDHDMMDAPQVVWDPESEQYVMLYQGYNIGEGLWGLGVATSVDGLAWTRLPTNPVVDFAAPTDGVGWCWPLGLSLGSVAGFTGYMAGYSGRNDACEMYRVDGADVRTWVTRDEVVFPAGDAGEWDDEGFASVAVAELDGQRWLFYAGFGTWVDHPEEGYRSGEDAYFGYAKEVDGAWVRQGRVPIHTSEPGQVRAVAARTVGSRIHLWVTDDYEGGSGIGYFLFAPGSGE